MAVSQNCLETRIATKEEVFQLLDWAAQEGWNPGLDDATLFYESDPGGFFVSTYDGRVVAGISVVKHSPTQAFLGLYLCEQEYRGRGVGLSTWNAALQTLEGQAIGLDGVVEQQANYAKSGFVYHFGNRRYSGSLQRMDNPEIAKEANSKCSLTTAGLDNAESVIEYDSHIGGFARPAYIRAFLAEGDSRYSFIAKENDAIVGFVGIRKCLEGFKVGPWLANSESIAIQLLQAAAQISSNSDVLIDVPDSNTSAISLFDRHSFEMTFETARMYRGLAPNIESHRLFGVATLELG